MRSGWFVQSFFWSCAFFFNKWPSQVELFAAVPRPPSPLEDTDRVPQTAESELFQPGGPAEHITVGWALVLVVYGVNGRLGGNELQRCHGQHFEEDVLWISANR